MRSNRQTTHQTTCDKDDCPAYTITAFYRPLTRQEQDAKHLRELAADGWTDLEGRDYCPDHNPHHQRA